MRSALASLGFVLAACGSDPPPIDATGPESACFDGLDNNGDLRTDCADSMCATEAACVAAIPPDWNDHAALYDGPVAGAPSCPEPFAQATMPGKGGLTAPAASCAACTCGPPTGGACEPGGGTATVPAVSWASIAVACAGAPTTATGCVDGACRPRPAAPFEAGVCVRHSGDVACPGAPYLNKHVFYGDVADSRACTPCTCDAPSGGACAPAGGQPTGTATPTGAVTYCCA